MSLSINGSFNGSISGSLNGEQVNSPAYNGVLNGSFDGSVNGSLSGSFDGSVSGSVNLDSPSSCTTTALAQSCPWRQSTNKILSSSTPADQAAHPTSGRAWPR
jgi:hypothetical protein